MKTIMVLLTLYAAGVATWLLVEKRDAAETPTASGGRPSSDDGRYEDLRTVMDEARRQARKEVKAVVKDVDRRLARIESLRKSMDEGLAATQEAAEGAARGSYSKLEEMERELRVAKGELVRLQVLIKRIGPLQRQVKAFEERIAALEARPAVAPPTPAAGDTPTEKPKPAPTRPDDLKTEPEKGSEQIRREIEQARRDLQSDDLDVLFPAIEKVRQHRVMDAVPRLLQILAGYKDEFGRTAAAAALGRMEVCDAVAPLAEALKDRSTLVSQQAHKAIVQITKMESHLSPTARAREKRAVSTRVKEWWRKHEDEVRARLGQPKG
jgi:hypothetical protein